MSIVNPKAGTKMGQAKNDARTTAQNTSETRETSGPVKPTISHRIKQTSRVSPVQDGLAQKLPTTKDKLQPKSDTKKLQEEKTQKNNKPQSVTLVQGSGDFLGRLGTLAVMLVTTISHTVVTVSSFGEEITWKFVLMAALLVFVHLPVTIAMIWVLCKARVKKIYKKVVPPKPPNDQPLPRAKLNEATETSGNSPKRKESRSKTVTQRASRASRQSV